MSLNQKTAAVLDDLLARGEPLGELLVEDGNRRLSLALTANAAVGVAFDRLDFQISDRSDATLEDLRAWGARLAAKLTYLMEPLVVLEVDPLETQVQLRSQKPSERADQRSFYELRIARPCSLALTRVTFDAADRKRRPAQCQLSREALERLVADLDRSIDG